MTEILYQPSPSTFGSAYFMTSLLVAGMIGGAALEVGISEEKPFPKNVVTLSATHDTPCSVQVTKPSPSMITNKEFESTVTSFYSALLASQEDLGHEFEEVLYQNLSSLYES